MTTPKLIKKKRQTRNSTAVATKNSRIKQKTKSQKKFNSIRNKLNRQTSRVYYNNEGPYITPLTGGKIPGGLLQ